jgi:hypothetical protein
MSWKGWIVLLDVSVVSVVSRPGPVVVTLLSSNLNTSNRERRRRIAQQSPQTEQTCIKTGYDQPGYNCESHSTKSSCDALSLITFNLSRISAPLHQRKDGQKLTLTCLLQQQNPLQILFDTPESPVSHTGSTFPHRGVCHGDWYLTALHRSFASQRCERCGTD